MSHDIQCADGNPYGDTWMGDPYPWSGVDSTNFSLWVQHRGIPSPIPVGWHARLIASTEDSASLSLVYQPTSPYLALEAINNQASIFPGGTIDLTFTVVNYGGTTEGGIATVFPDTLLPSFQLQVPVGVQPLDTVELQALGNVQIPDDFAMVGARVPIGVMFEANYWQDTLRVYLPEAGGQALPLCTGPMVSNAQEDLAVVATAPSVATALRFRQVIWNRSVLGTIVGIAIDPTGQHVGVATDQNGIGHVYQLSSPLGQVQQHWSFPGQQLAKPGVAFAYGYITWVVGDRLHRFTLDGIAFEDLERESLGLPTIPTGFACGADSTYCIVGGDTSTVSGFVIVLNFWGDRVFPIPGNLIPVNDFAYLPPVGGDMNGDGIRTEYVVPFIGDPYGGHVIVAYSAYWDSIGVGTTRYANFGSSQRRQPVLGGFGWTRDLLDDQPIGTRLLWASSGIALNYSAQLITDGTIGSSVTMSGESSWHVASVDLIGLGYSSLLLTAPVHGELRMAKRNGTPLVSGGSFAVTSSDNLFLGPSLVVRGEDWTSEIWAPTQDIGGWRYASYGTQGFGADWYGTNGDGQNTRCHGFRGELGVPGAPDSGIVLTINYAPSQGELLLAWSASIPSGVNGYHIYDAPSPDGPWAIIRTVATTQSYAWATIPIPSGNILKRFYHVTAILPEAPDPNAPDGSLYWGEHEE